ncbi:MAG TPA: outer membrane protein assembly factor BamB, partial [Candidatus Acidoferrum sp.]|nr:outer membrane protein assembly factor BamB [Candidatus Acidoferrum sp.]
AGCSWHMWDFMRDDKVKRPSRIEDVKDEVRIRKNWSVGVGNGQGKQFNRLRPELASGIVYAASNNGVIAAVRAGDGKRLWKQDIDVEITGGVGVGGGLALVGTRDAVVYALDAAKGQVRWKATLSSEILAAPAANDRFVVVQGVDGRITGLDAKTGKVVWTYDSQVPNLSLRGTSTPLIIGNTVLSGQAGGSVIALALDNGTLRWEERVALPKGKSDIDRLVDVDGDLIVVDGNVLLVPSYQGNFDAIDVNTGQTRWRTKASSFVGAAAGFGNVYVVADDDTVSAYKMGGNTQDTPQWTNDKMHWHRLTTPVAFSNYLAVGDVEGYLLLLAQSDGRFVGREKVDGDGLRSRMVAEGNNLYIFSNGGDLVSYTVTDLSSKK